MNNRKYSILIIAFECHYSHIERFIKYLKHTNPLVDITLFADEHVITEDIRINVKSIVYKKRYTDNHKVLNKDLTKFLNKLVLLRQFKTMSTTERYDLINIHFAQYYMSYMIRYLKRMSHHIAVTPWGSDVLRLKSKFKKALLKKVYLNSDIITAGKLGPIGKAICNDFKPDIKKMVPLSWGSETIDFINDHLELISKERAKERLHLDGHYIITCGYNAFKEQRHEAIIDAISQIKDSLPSNLILLFPVTYGTESIRKKYTSSLKNKCATLGLKACFFEDYLSVEDTFLLRRASDMFIHIQTTDAGNSTIMEYCICENKIIHGSWMHYKWLDIPPRFYFPLDDLKDLSDIILNAFQSAPLQIPEEVVDRIKNRSWKLKMIEWNDTFMSLVSEKE